MNDISVKVAEMYNKYPFPLKGNYNNFFEACLYPFIKELNTKSPIRRLLDAGCGTGNVAIDLAKRFPDIDVLGIDFTDRSLEIAKKNAAKLKLKNIRFEKSDLMQHDQALGEYDFAVCSGVIHHLAEPLRGLINLNSYLHKGSYAFVWIYLLAGKKDVLELRESLNILGIEGLSWEEKINLASKISGVFDKKTFIKRIINVLKRIDKHGLKGFRRFLTGYFFSEKIPNDILLADQILHPKDKFYRFSEAIEEFEKAGFKFIKILEGMPNSIKECFGNEEITTFTKKSLSQIDIYRLIELKEKPPGVGCLIQKT